MKKFYYLSMAALALMATACSSDETVEMSPSSKQAIGFNAFVDKSVRSAQDPSYNNTTNRPGFLAYGVRVKDTEQLWIFDGQQVAQDGTYSPMQPWQAGYTYYFAGVVPQTTSGISRELTTDNQIKLTVANFTNTDGQTDLMFSTLHTQSELSTIDESTTINNVALTFSHALARVKFSFQNGESADKGIGGASKLKVTEVKITDAYDKGTATWTAGAATSLSWDVSGAGSSQEISFGNVTTDEATSDAATAIPAGEQLETYKQCLLIPSGSSKSYTVTFTATITGAVEKTKNFTATISNVDLKAGYSYDFCATLTYENITDETIKYIQFDAPTITEYGAPTEVGTEGGYTYNGTGGGTEQTGSYTQGDSTTPAASGE